ncbi:MAG: hypothetical protein JWM68_1155 [Verrucomicrobiales bacterium]|nr:hypothetical protein [Verrucomicrobiales bacterium]
MEFLEGNRLVRECRLFLALYRAVVRHGEKETSRRAHFVLVAQSRRIASAADLRAPTKRLCLHFCLRVHLDSLHPELDDSA